jgi:hypothetical protein
MMRRTQGQAQPEMFVDPGTRTRTSGGLHFRHFDIYSRADAFHPAAGGDLIISLRQRLQRALMPTISQA